MNKVDEIVKLAREALEDGGGGHMRHWRAYNREENLAEGIMVLQAMRTVLRNMAEALETCVIANTPSHQRYRRGSAPEWGSPPPATVSEMRKWAKKLRDQLGEKPQC